MCFIQNALDLHIRSTESAKNQVFVFCTICVVFVAKKPKKGPKIVWSGLFEWFLNKLCRHLTQNALYLWIAPIGGEKFPVFVLWAASVVSVAKKTQKGRLSEWFLNNLLRHPTQNDFKLWMMSTKCITNSVFVLWAIFVDSVAQKPKTGPRMAIFRALSLLSQCHLQVAN